MKTFIIAFALTLTSVSAFAQSQATLILKGEVNRQLSISIIADNLAGNLPLDVSQNGTRVARVQEKSNSKTGYKVAIDSANDGVLKRTNGNHTFPYSLAYNGQSLDLSQVVEVSYPAASAVTQIRDLNISYTGVPADEMVAGEYVDTITFSISAN